VERLMAKRIVLSDLDGTLLDARTYDWRPAIPALWRLERLGVPLILTSSKTRAEIEVWRQTFGNGEVFVSENGGGVYFPERCRARPPADAEPWDGYERIALGVPYERLRAALMEIRRETALPLLGFGDMSVEEVQARTGLERAEAERSMDREFDEPFLWQEPGEASDVARLAEAALARGLRVSRGGRFFHLHGPHDKGGCVRAIAEAYGEGDQPAATVGIGDSANDRDLLSMVDRAAVVARSQGAHDGDLKRAISSAYFTPSPGPAGFAEAIEFLFKE
jgi:mannosyl-3-phosphoglycerate phosphatase